MKRSKHLWIQAVFWIMFIIPYFKPASFDYISSFAPLDGLFNAWKLAVYAIIIVQYFFKGKVKVSKILIAIGIYEAILCFSTFANDGDLYTFSLSCMDIISFCMMIEMCVRRNAIWFIKQMLNVLTVLYIINLATLILFPAGYYVSIGIRSVNKLGNWFMGLDNTQISYILPLVCFWTLYATYKEYTLFRKVLFIILFSLFMYITWVASSVFALFVFTMLIIYEEIKSNQKIFNIKTYYIVHIIFFLAIIVFRVQDIFSYLIDDILQKDITFSGRLIIWDNAMNCIKQHPWFGWGHEHIINNYIRIDASHCHNYYLNVLYESGIIGMVAFLAILVIIIKPLMQCKSKYSFIIATSLFAYMFIYQMEVFVNNSTTFFGIITMAYYAPLLARQVDKNGLVREGI